MTFDRWWDTYGGEFDPRARVTLQHLWQTAHAHARERCAQVVERYPDDPHVSTAYDRGHLELICEELAHRLRGNL